MSAMHEERYIEYIEIDEIGIGVIVSRNMRYGFVWNSVVH